MCPPLNLSRQTRPEQAETHRRCGPHVALEQSVGLAAGYCGRRIKRRNPCWRERGETHCLPRFFILGEMKCGTTTLYHLLDQHPQASSP